MLISCTESWRDHSEELVHHPHFLGKDTETQRGEAGLDSYLYLGYQGSLNGRTSLWQNTEGQKLDWGKRVDSETPLAEPFIEML